MKATVVACCIVLILLSSLSLVDGFGPGCRLTNGGCDPGRQKERAKLRDEFTQLINKRRMQEKQAKLRREICLAARELNC